MTSREAHQKVGAANRLHLISTRRHVELSTDVRVELLDLGCGLAGRIEFLHGQAVLLSAGVGDVLMHQHRTDLVMQLGHAGHGGSEFGAMMSRAEGQHDRVGLSLLNFQNPEG